MVIWGAIWGLILGWLWPGHGFMEMVAPLLGAILGAVAGRTLRGVVRSEIEAQRARWAAEPALAPAAEVALASGAATQTSATPAPASAPPVDEAAASAQAATAQDAVAPVPDKPVSQPAQDEAGFAPWPAAPSATSGPDPVTLALGKFKAWLFGGNTVVRMGVLVLFVGLAFLAKYAVDHALLPPELRLAGIACAGIGLFGFGFWLRRREGRLAYALTLQGAGVAVLYLTVFAAFRLYQFLPAGSAFVMLGLICAFSAAIALAQNSMAMAFIGFAGGFAAPILVSTGSGNHVNLFSYYLVLNLAIVTMAWFKAWRALNLLGFFATFGVATAWGALRYQREQLASTEPFLIAFFLLFVVASLLYATRHSLGAKQAVDATLVFGTPIIAFGLQTGLVRHIEYASAFSALALATFYLVLGWWMFRRRPLRPAADGQEHDPQVGRWLAECYAALGLGFATLAVPLALDEQLTSAVWAAEGAAVYWMGRRQGRWLARAAGLALQALAALAYLKALGHGPDAPWPLANQAFIGALLLAASALGIAFWSRAAPTLHGASPPAAGPAPLSVAQIETQLSPLLFWIGFLWWQFALGQEIARAPVNALGIAEAVFSNATQAHLHMLGWVASAYAAARLALPANAQALPVAWPIAATPAWFTLPVMFLGALLGMAQLNHVFQSWGWLVWPATIVLHLATLRRLDAGSPQPWWRWVHAGGVWLLVLLGANLLLFAVDELKLWDSAWASVVLLDAGVAVLLVLCDRRWFDAAGPGRARWPLERFAGSYLWRAALPLALAVALGSVLVALHSNGDARPLPYVPLLNPTDLSVALGLAVSALWLVRQRAASFAPAAWARHPGPNIGLAAFAFVAINSVWLRVAHHYAGVPWDAGRLFDSFLVQAGYSILWTLMALGLMLSGARRSMRKLWMLGAALMGATVAKLFLIDLANQGGSERIVVFIAVGVLMLVIGYFAPIPPPAAPRVELDKEPA
jgi:uncharacterized membrane protein